MMLCIVMPYVDEILVDEILRADGVSVSTLQIRIQDESGEE